MPSVVSKNMFPDFALTHRGHLSANIQQFIKIWCPFWIVQISAFPCWDFFALLVWCSGDLVSSIWGSLKHHILYVFQRSNWSRRCHVIWRTSGDVTRCRVWSPGVASVTYFRWRHQMSCLITRRRLCDVLQVTSPDVVSVHQMSPLWRTSGDVTRCRVWSPGVTSVTYFRWRHQMSCLITRCRLCFFYHLHVKAVSFTCQSTWI